MCQKKIQKEKLLICVSYLWILGSFELLDVWLRVETRWINAYSIYSPVPNLFTFLWAILLTSLLSMIPSRKTGRIVYGVLYYVFMIYAVAQYGAYLTIGRFLYISDFLYAGEGGSYVSWAVDLLLTPQLLLQVTILALVGAIGILLYPKYECNAQKRRSNLLAYLFVVAICVFTMMAIPNLYGDINNGEQWAMNPAIEYQRFVNANYDLELTGMYQYIFRDAQTQMGRYKSQEDNIERVSEFFSNKAEHTDNDFTNIFKGKNLIVVMMESMDDWVISEADTPTIHYMMNNGLNFTNLFTPEYSSGYTFNTEFAFNTSIYPYSNGNAAYALSRNSFTNSIASKFADAGYSVESFHEGISTFYNRANMHSAFGFSKYNYYGDYPSDGYSIEDDRYLVESNELYENLISGEPFFSFVITYSPHLPYSDEDKTVKTALAIYPQYDVAENREINVLRAKARLTDDMFAGLLERLKEDGLLENTVIVGFADHYAYGISDREALQRLSEDAGNSILEKTPAFIYCAGCDLPVEIDKVMQITDLAPTIMNLFGIDVSTEIMGQDIFDENYVGYAIFPNGTWLTNSTYVKNGVVQWNYDMSKEEIAEMNAYVQQVYEINDAILDSDYYK